jgi:hypothetical protein
MLPFLGSEPIAVMTHDRVDALHPMRDNTP